MRTVSDEVSVRLYHLDDDGKATTLMYGSMAAALALAAQQDEGMQAGLFVQTDNDIVPYLDLEEG